MNKDELEVFYQLDEKKYRVNKNEEFVSLLQQLGIAEEEEYVQDFINKLKSWYELKFSDRFLDFVDDKAHKPMDTDIIDIMTLDQLEQRFNTFELHLCQKQNYYMGQLREKLVYLAGLALIYSKNSNPEYGYYRAKALFIDFNTYYNCGLHIECYDPIMKGNYDPNDPEVVQLVTRKKERDKKDKRSVSKKRKRNTLRKVKSLFGQ